MPIGLETRFVFVGNTKNASTSIQQVPTPHAEYRHGGITRREHIALLQIDAPTLPVAIASRRRVEPSMPAQLLDEVHAHYADTHTLLND